MTSATGNSGFTLLELLTVLAILVLLAGTWPFAAARLFPTQQLRNETQQLIATLRSVRTLALSSGTVQSIEISSSATSYMTAIETHDLPKGVQLHIRSPGSTSTASSVAFYPDGSSTGAVLDLSLLQRRESVRVGSLTGRAEMLP